jgi:hypothetical protein
MPILHGMTGSQVTLVLIVALPWLAFFVVIFRASTAVAIRGLTWDDPGRLGCGWFRCEAAASQ